MPHNYCKIVRVSGLLGTERYWFVVTSASNQWSPLMNPFNDLEDLPLRLNHLLTFWLVLQALEQKASLHPKLLEKIEEAEKLFAWNHFRSLLRHGVIMMVEAKMLLLPKGCQTKSKWTIWSKGIIDWSAVAVIQQNWHILIKISILGKFYWRQKH